MISEAELNALVADLRRAPVLPAGSGIEVVLDRAAVEARIPHRGSMLLLDGIDAIDEPGERLRAHRVMDAGDPIFAGHFPGAPVYPGVLLTEMIGQAGLCLLSTGRAASNPGTATLLRIDRALFIAPVRPGARLEIHARVVEDGGLTSTLAGQVVVQGQVVAVAVISVLGAD